MEGESAKKNKTGVEALASRDSVAVLASAKGGLYIKTYGCQMNVYDSLKLQRILQDRYRMVGTPQCADLILINTCAVRGKPEQKLYSLLGELGPLKKKNPSLLIGVGGCVAQRQAEEILKRSWVVDFVFGTHNLSLVPSLIDLRQRGFPPQAAVDYRADWEALPLGFPAESGVSVPVAISRGCDNKCTFCVVPQARGRQVSRPAEEILREVRMAVSQGAREVVLLGQTVNSYGYDLRPRQSFVDLLHKVMAVDGLERIRFTSPHPKHVSLEFVQAMGSSEKICRHIHLPLQSGSDGVLKAMRRNYSRADYLHVVQMLKAHIPDLAITTDIIVGFPGESEQDFEATLELMDLVQFDNSYSFVFSARPGTEAAAMVDTLPYAEKLSRLHVLQNKQEAITATRLKKWLGRRVEVLLEVQSSKTSPQWQGRTSQNFVLNIDTPAQNLKAGLLVETQVTEVARFTLRGELTGIVRPC